MAEGRGAKRRRPTSKGSQSSSLALERPPSWLSAAMAAPSGASKPRTLPRPLKISRSVLRRAHLPLMGVEDFYSHPSLWVHNFLPECLPLADVPSVLAAGPWQPVLAFPSPRREEAIYGPAIQSCC